MSLYKGKRIPLPQTSETTEGRTSDRMWFEAVTDAINQPSQLFVDMGDFNPRGDGEADDTKAIKGAIIEAVKKGAIVRMPPGVFRVTSTISCPSQTRLVGSGRRISSSGTLASIIKRDFSGVIFDCVGVDGAHTENVHFSNFLVDGNETSAATGTVFDIRYTTGAHLRDVETVYNIGSAIKMAQTWDAVVENCWVRRSGNTIDGDAAVHLDDTATDGCDRVDFYSLHCESNYTTHVLLEATNATKDPKWVNFIAPKIHDFIPIASRLTVPLMHVKAADNMSIIGGQFSIGSAEQLLCAADTSRVIGTVMEDCGGDYALLINGGNRSMYDVIVNTSRAQVAKIGVTSSAQNHFVRAIVNGSGSNFSNTGSNVLFVNAQDGILSLQSGRQNIFGQAIIGSLAAAADARQRAIVTRQDNGDVFLTLAPGSTASNTEVHFHSASGLPLANIRGRVRYESNNDKMELWAANAEKVAFDASKVTFSYGTINVSNSFTPASGTAAGAQGDITWDGSFVYVCTSANSWSRAALATF